MDSLYKEFILDLHRNPLHKVELKKSDITVHGHNPSCGDDYMFQMKVDETSLLDAGYQGTGCAISNAACSLLLDHIIGRDKKDIIHMTKQEMIELLNIEVSYSREKCAMLALTTIQKALQTYES